MHIYFCEEYVDSAYNTLGGEFLFGTWGAYHLGGTWDSKNPINGETLEPARHHVHKNAGEAFIFSKYFLFSHPKNWEIHEIHFDIF